MPLRRSRLLTTRPQKTLFKGSCRYVASWQSSFPTPFHLCAVASTALGSYCFTADTSAFQSDRVIHATADPSCIRTFLHTLSQTPSIINNPQPYGPNPLVSLNGYRTASSFLIQTFFFFFVTRCSTHNSLAFAAIKDLMKRGSHSSLAMPRSLQQRIRALDLQPSAAVGMPSGLK